MDIYVRKLDSDGNLLWVAQLGSTGYDRATDVEVDAAGNVHVVGHIQLTADFDPGPGTFPLTGVGSNGISPFVWKLDTDGDLVWAVHVGGSGSSNDGRSLALDGSGNVYVSGSFTGTGDFDPGPGTVTLTSAGGSLGDVYGLKLDSAGTLLWAVRMGGAGSDRGNAIGVDGSGNVYFSGSFSSTMDADPGPGTFNLTGSGQDSFFVKLDSGGAFVSAHRTGGSSTEDSLGLATDGSGNVYETGYFSGTVDFDHGAGTSNLTTVGPRDIYVRKLDSAGDLVWAVAMGGNSTVTNADGGTDIQLDDAGNVYTSGHFEGTGDFDPGAGTFNMTSPGGRDGFVQKMDGDGNFDWAIQVSGTDLDFIDAITVSGEDELVAVGYFRGTADFDPGAGTSNLTSAGGSDAFVVRLGALPPPATVTFDGFPDGDLLGSFVEHFEGDWVIEYFNSADGAAWIDAGGGDIGVEDIIDGDGLGIPLRISRADGLQFTYDSVLGYDRDPSVDGTPWGIRVVGFLDGGVNIGEDDYLDLPDTVEEYFASVLLDVPVDYVCLYVMHHGGRDTVTTGINLTTIPAVPPPASTVTFDGFTAGDLLGTGVVHTEGDWEIEYDHFAGQAGWFNAGGGDIGLEDTVEDVVGIPTWIRRTDGGSFTFDSVFGYDRDPSLDSASPSHNFGITVHGFLGGVIVDTERFANLPLTIDEYPSVLLAGITFDELRVDVIDHDGRNAVITGLNMTTIPAATPTVNFDSQVPGTNAGDTVTTENGFDYWRVPTHVVSHPGDASYVDMGAGDIGIEDVDHDGHGIVFYMVRSDGGDFTFDAVHGLNRTGLVPFSTGGIRIFGMVDGVDVASDIYYSDSTTLTEFAAANLDGVVIDQLRFTLFWHTPFDSDTVITGFDLTSVEVTDTDGDGVDDDDDFCPTEDATACDSDFDGCLDDGDGDGVTDCDDICPMEDAFDCDFDSDGCLDDSDGDGVIDCDDSCPTVDGLLCGLDVDVDGCPDDSDGDLVDCTLDCDDTVGTCTTDCTTDTDGDLLADCADTCLDSDGDGFGGAGGAGNTCTAADCDDAAATCSTDCTGDSDGDSVADCADVCFGDDATGDTDGDGVCDDAEPTMLGPSAYLQASDSPLTGDTYTYFHLEDFEDGVLDTPGLSVTSGVVLTTGSNLDSVDADDGCIDGSGSTGNSWYQFPAPDGTTFVFDEAALGGLPTRVGIVATDGLDLTTVEVRDASGVTIGELSATPFVLSVFTGETDEDRFFGAEFDGGIGSIFVMGAVGGIEVDHIQYGLADTGGTLYDPAAIDNDCDGDGFGVTTDCDDTDATINPDATETCDGVDEDCDTVIDDGFDVDVDGHTTCAGDCDDADPAINPDATEVCDAVDNDCDTSIDEGFDVDVDTFTSCAGDCDDADPAINPDATEVCDAADNDCDTSIDEGFDVDVDGHTTCAGDCDDADPAINPDATEVCDAVDNDCDTSIDEGFDVDVDTFTSCAGDCDDTDPAINPDATEVCDGVDEDCDTVVDDGFDVDEDGHTTCAGDCDDADPAINPDATEVCDSIDNDCDASVDEGFDVDDDGYTSCAGDCDDTDPDVSPDGVEVCDSIDNDCDLLVDGDDGDIPDTDFDGVNDCDDICPLSSPDDTDEDGVCDDVDAVVCSRELDFDSDSSGVTILAGQDLGDVYADWSTTILAWTDDDMDPEDLGLPIAFDSAMPTGGDTDLETPGTGDGNDVPLGNLLISAENFIDVDGDDLIDDPDDDADGAWIEFFFDEPLCVNSLDLIDIEHNEGPVDILLWDEFGARLDHIQAAGEGDNSVQTVAINVCGVAEMMIDLYGSGAIDNVVVGTDTDGDGVCGAADECPDDDGKTEAGICGCGVSDLDSDGDGTPNCLEAELDLDPKRAHINFRDTNPYAMFSGAIELLGGLLAPDFRDGDTGYGALSVTLGETSPVTLYDNDAIAYSVHDHADPADNKEKWRFKESSHERVTLRWKNSHSYDSRRDSDASVKTLGRLQSRFIHVDESLLRFKYKSSSLPLTVTIDGIHLVTVDAAGNVDTDHPHGKWSRRRNNVQILFPDRLGEGNVIAWYADGDPDDGITGLLYSHEAIDDGSEESTFYNAGGRYQVRVPIGAAGVDETFAEQTATMTLTVGDTTTTTIASGNAEHSTWWSWGHHWWYRDDWDCD